MTTDPVSAYDHLTEAELVRRVVNREVGQVIQDARTELGISQRTLCDRAGVKASLLSKIESGSRAMSAEVRAKLSDAFEGQLSPPFEEQVNERSEAKWHEVRGKDKVTLVRALLAYDKRPRPPRSDIVFRGGAMDLKAHPARPGVRSALEQAQMFADASGHPDAKIMLVDFTHAVRQQRDTSTTLAAKLALDLVDNAAALEFPQDGQRLAQLQGLFHDVAKLSDEDLQKVTRLATQLAGGWHGGPASSTD